MGNLSRRYADAKPQDTMRARPVSVREIKLAIAKEAVKRVKPKPRKKAKAKT